MIYKIKIQDDEIFAYSMGRIRALENLLLDKEKVERMLSSSDPNIFTSVLNETTFTDDLSLISRPEDFQKVLNSHLKRTKKFILKITPPSSHKDLSFLWLKYDVQNAKVLLKARLEKKEIRDNYLSGLGNVSKGKLKKYISNNEIEEETSEQEKENVFFKFIDRAKETKEPEEIDFALDKAYFGLLSEYSKLSYYQVIKDLIKIWIDLYNIKTFIRAKILEKDKKFLKKVLTPHGSFDLKFFAKLLSLGLEKLPGEFKDSPYGKIVEEAIDYYSKNNSLSILDKLIYDFEMSFLKEENKVSLGIAPVIGYMLAKENEVRVLRIIMIGKLRRIPREEIEKYIGILY